MNGYMCYNRVKMAVEDMEKHYFHHPIGNLLLHYDAVWVKKHRGYLSKDNYYLAVRPNS